MLRTPHRRQRLRLLLLKPAPPETVAERIQASSHSSSQDINNECDCRIVLRPRVRLVDRRTEWQHGDGSTPGQSQVNGCRSVETARPDQAERLLCCDFSSNWLHYSQLTPW